MEKGSFIDFIVLCSHDASLAKKFLLLLSRDDLTLEELQDFLGQYCILQQGEAEKIFEARNNICSVFNSQLKY